MCGQSAGICLVKSPTQQHRLIGPPSLRLQTPANSRHRRGRRHSFVNNLPTACSAVLTGARPFAATGQWARSAPWYPLARLGALAPTVFDARIAPSTATTRRVRNAACPGATADLLGSIRRGPKPTWWTARRRGIAPRRDLGRPSAGRGTADLAVTPLRVQDKTNGITGFDELDCSGRAVEDREVVDPCAEGAAAGRRKAGRT